MRISMLSTFYPFRGGIAQFGAKLHRNLEQNGHEVKSYTFTTQYPSILFPGKTQFVEQGDSADAIETDRVLSSVNPLSFVKTAKKIKSDNPDLFISQYWMTFFAASFGFVHKRLKKHTKSIAILHNVIPHEKKFYDAAANRYFLKHIDGFVVMSDVVENDLLSLKPNAKYIRIDHPIYDHFGGVIKRSDALDSLGLDQTKKYLLFFGFVRKYKGLDILLESLALLDEDIHVIVAGEVYGNFESYQQIINRYQLADRVHLFTEYISDAEVAKYFCASDVCILPYRSATQSGITAIAHHFEIPLIATNVGGLKSTIRNTGLIAEEVNPNSIVEQVDLFFNESKATVLKKNIQELKNENSWENFTRRILEFSMTLN